MNHPPDAKKITVPQWIHAGTCVVRVDVEGLLLPDCPDEPSFTPETVRRLEHLQSLADAGQINELLKHGTVYVRKSA